MQQKWEVASIYSIERFTSNWKKVESSQEENGIYTSVSCKTKADG